MSIIALYVQKGETPYRQFFQENLYQLQLGFQRRGYNLVFLPAITQHQNPNFKEGLQQYLDVYYPSFKKLNNVQQQQALFIVASTSSEQEVYDKLDEMFGLDLANGAYLFFLKPGYFEFEKLPEDAHPSEALRDYLQFQSHSELSEREAVFDQSVPRKSSSWSWVKGLFRSDRDEFELSSPEITENTVVGELQQFVEAECTVISPELQRLFDTVNALQLQQGLRELLEVVLGRYTQGEDSPKVPLLQPLERVRFDAEGRVFVGQQPVKMNPICRSVYKLFLNHPDGIELRMLSDYRPELLGYYTNMATHTNPAILRDRINLICDPRENSINEKLSQINAAFEKLLGEEVCKPYQILGVRGGPKKINLRREFRG